jgi:hypothetical protein
MQTLERKYQKFELFLLREMHANIDAGSGLDWRFEGWIDKGITLEKGAGLRKDYIRVISPVELRDKTGMYIHETGGGPTTLPAIRDCAKRMGLYLFVREVRDHIIAEKTKYVTITYYGNRIFCSLDLCNFKAGNIEAIENLLGQLPVRVNPLDFTRAKEEANTPVIENIECNMLISHRHQILNSVQRVTLLNNENTINLLMASLAQHTNNGYLHISTADFKSKLDEVLSIVYGKH